jgi:CO dehydrogenase/acetyl-CoA synthase delta subunit
MMMHPAAVKTLKEIIEELKSRGKAGPEMIADWVSGRI